LEKGGDDESVPAATVPEDVEPSEKGLLGDARFARLFQDEDFNVDETSRNFNP
jgi:ribosome biogenesis protein ENP2